MEPEFLDYCRPRFWLKVKKAEGCWEWQGSRQSHGYGMVRAKPKTNGKVKRVLAHRVAYGLEYGCYDASMNVLHRCDNPRCVRPDHLFLGTHADNMRDKAAKGRAGVRGARHGKAKLTDARVRAMRKVRRDTGLSYAKIAMRFKVSRAVAHAATTGRTWKHVA